MDRCIGCHEKQSAPTACATCHITQPSGRLATEFASGKLEPSRLHTFAIRIVHHDWNAVGGDMHVELDGIGTERDGLSK